MILEFTIKTGILLFILIAMVVILSYILRKKLVEDDLSPEVTNTTNLNIEELKKRDMKDKMMGIKENTSFVPNPDDEEKTSEYNAIRKEEDDIEIL